MENEKIEIAEQIEKKTAKLAVKNDIFNPPPQALLRVSTGTEARRLAGAINATLSNHGFVYLRAIGDGAIGAACRAFAISRGHMSQVGVEIVMVCSFFDTVVTNRKTGVEEERTGLTILIESR